MRRFQLMLRIALQLTPLLLATLSPDALSAVSFTKVQDLIFHPGVAGDGTAVIDPTTATAFAAKFSITGGSANGSCNITLPGNSNMSLGGTSVTAGTFTSSPATSITLDATGAGTLYVGATHGAIAAGAGSGTYTSGNITMKVKCAGTNYSTTFLAKIVVTSSIGLSKVTDMGFGDCAPGDGAETLSPVDGSCSGIGCFGANTRAQFNVTGGASISYNITLPSSVTLTESGAGCLGTGTTTLTVNAFTASPASAGSQTTVGTLSAQGTDTFYVGATRGAVAANQDACAYQGTYTITVTYW